MQQQKPNTRKFECGNDCYLKGNDRAHMTTWFISRHAGALEWAARQHLCVDRIEPHLNLDLIQGGDTVIGNLPINLAAQVCALQATYLHLSLTLPAAMRGVELSANDLERLGAKIERFDIKPMPVPMPSASTPIKNNT